MEISNLLLKWKKIILVIKWQRILLHSVVAFASDEIGYLGKEISKQSIEGAAWLPLTNYKWNAGDRRIEEGIVKQNKEPEPEDWKILNLSIYWKTWESIFWWKHQGVAGLLLNKEFMLAGSVA